MPYASKHYPFEEKFYNFKYKIIEAQSIKEQKEIFDFFIPMWKEEFNIDIHYENEKENNYKVFYIKQ
jgi:hypothetical protein